MEAEAERKLREKHRRRRKGCGDENKEEVSSKSTRRSRKQNLFCAKQQLNVEYIREGSSGGESRSMNDRNRDSQVMARSTD